MRRGIIYAIASQIGIQAIGLGTGIFVARVLGPDGRGQLATVISWASMVTYLGNLGLPVALTYASAKYPEQRHQLLGNGIAIALIQWAILAFIGVVFFPVILGTKHLTIVHLSVLYLCAYLPLNLITLYANSIQQGAGKYGHFVSVKLNNPISYALLLLLFWGLNSLTVSSVLLVSILSNLLTLVLVLTLTLPDAFTRVRKSTFKWIDAKNAKRDLHYGLRAQIGTLQPFAGLRIDVLALTLLATTHEIGLYMVALAAASLVRAQGFALGQIVLPEVARTDDRQRQKRIVSQMLIFAIVGGTVAFFAVMLWADFLIQLVYGVEYVPASNMMKILVLAGAIKTIETVLADGLRGMGRPLPSTMAELMGMAVGVPALAISIAAYGGVGVAIAVLLASITSLATVVWGWRRNGTKTPTLEGSAGW